MSKQILIESISFAPTNASSIQESLDKGTSLFVEGIIQRANTKNQNGRIYPKEILNRAVTRYLEGPIKENRALGELDHAQDNIIHLNNVSHNIKKLWWEQDDLCSRIEILNTPSGRILKELFKAGINVGISSRGTGSVRELFKENAVEVQNDFELLCWDFVSNPSTQGAFMQPVGLNESVDPNIVINPYSRANILISEIFCNVKGYCECEF
jgi:hypothetical protein